VYRKVGLLNSEFLHRQSVSIFEVDSQMYANVSVTSKSQLCDINSIEVNIILLKYLMNFGRLTISSVFYVKSFAPMEKV